MFRIKFKWEETNDEGKTVKEKKEVVAQCVNYTDAEKLALNLMEIDNMENAEYEIVKEKFTVSDICIAPSVTDSEDEVCGLAEVFFVEGKSRMYQIKVEFGGEFEKPTVSLFYVLASSTIDAINWLKKNIAFFGLGSSYTIKKTSDDNMELLYLNPNDFDRAMGNTSEVSNGL